MAGQSATVTPQRGEPPIAHLVLPIQEFIHNSSASGIVLMAATALALVIANSPLADEYDALLHAYIGISIGPFQLRENVLHWVNDGLMAIFFFLIGLEIKREVRVGEFANPRAAILPIVAAIGGVAIPALLFTLLNAGGPGAAGWAIPMATDIAFALGILALLGNRIPFTLKIFLTAVAIVDDLIAVLVIALFYSGSLNLVALGFGFAVLGVLVLANLLGVRSTLVYIGLGVLVWLGFLQSGVHATIAGVLVALTVPARNRIDPSVFLDRIYSLTRRFEQSPLEPSTMVTDDVQQTVVIELEEACEDVQAPLQKLEHSLHTWVQFLIVPIFALANAGVPLSVGNVADGATPVMLGIVLGLVVGKFTGLLGLSYVAVRTGLAPLPEGVVWRHMVGVSFLAGIGFTMSLFIASLGFGQSELLEAAKLGILGASLIAGSIGFFLLPSTSPIEQTASAADQAPREKEHIQLAKHG
ncbi:MAG: Na+/H+ antiporter NhaA [Chloroflexota bacterium]|nr:Na+/H+ antiporter NhaA [Chloroflexota bacterium]